VASRDAKRLARALERAEARHQVTDPGSELSFDVLLLGALTELRVEADMQRARERRRIRKAVRRMAAADEVLARLPGVAAVVEPSSGRFAPPEWHPDHHLNSENN